MENSYTYTESKLKDILWYFYAEENPGAYTKSGKETFDEMVSAFFQGKDIYHREKPGHTTVEHNGAVEIEGMSAKNPRPWEPFTCWCETKCMRCGNIAKWEYGRNVENVFNQENWKKLHDWAMKYIDSHQVMNCVKCGKGTIQQIVAYTDKGGSL